MLCSALIMLGGRRFRLLVATMIAVLYAATSSRGSSSSEQEIFQVKELRIPMRQALPSGLEALLVVPNEPGRHPLAVLTHGTPATAEERAAMTPQRMLPLAMEFARRGWATAIVMRRNYGTSGGRYAESSYSCTYPDYMHPARESSRDLRAAIDYLSTFPDIDPTRIIAIGPSGGGLAVVALTVDPPPGLVAVINFAGGWGHIAPDTVCQPGSLLSTFWLLGKKSRIPMLWVYAKNDHFIPASLAESLYQQFAEAGAKVTFIAAPPFGSEGHALFTPAGIPLWTRHVDIFLKEQGLVLRPKLLPLPLVPRVPAPKELSAAGRKVFQLYLAAPGEKAFAVAPDGYWGYDFGRRDLDDAEKTAVAFCSQHGVQCRTAVLNNVAIR
jgi:dienelactone hydrolase